MWYSIAYSKYKNPEYIIDRCSYLYPYLNCNGRFLSFYGNHLLIKGDYKKALLMFKRAVQGLSNNPEDIDGIAYSYARQSSLSNALVNYQIASSLRPWRLTPHMSMAEIYRSTSDFSNAVKHAQLVVNIPMKKWTERGKNFKLKSQKMLIEFGQKCDDPGLIVFDINDKKTWNEGKW